MEVELSLQLRIDGEFYNRGKYVYDIKFERYKKKICKLIICEYMDKESLKEINEIIPPYLPEKIAKAEVLFLDWANLNKDGEPEEISRVELKNLEFLCDNAWFDRDKGYFCRSHTYACI